MDIAQPGDIAHSIFVWLLGGKHHVPELAGIVPLTPDRVAAVVSEEWLYEPERLAIWCYCVLLAKCNTVGSPQRLEALRSALQIPANFFLRTADAIDENDCRPDVLITNPPLKISSAITACIVEWLAQHPREPQCLNGLTSAIFEHPWDRRALDTLKAVPFLEKVTSWVFDFRLKPMILGLIASAFEVTESSLPALYRTYKKAANALGFTEAPPLYVEDDGGTLNAYTTGADKPIVIITNRLVSDLTNDELLYVFGHELGHVMAGHVKYNVLYNEIIGIGEDIAQIVPVLGQLGMMGVRNTLLPALRAWSRCAEYTADRAGMLACQNEEAVWRSMLKIMGYPREYYGNLNGRSLLNQAIRFEGIHKGSLIERAFELRSIMYGTHPRWVHRALELYKWNREGNVDEIVHAGPEGRRAMAEHVARDPRHHAFTTAINKELTDWAVSEFSTQRRHCSPVIRRMMQQYSPPDESPLAAIMQIELVIQKAESEILYTVHVVLLRSGQPVRVSLELPWTTGWDEAPDEIRGEFIRSNEDTLARVLYTITERR